MLRLFLAVVFVVVTGIAIVAAPLYAQNAQETLLGVDIARTYSIYESEVEAGDIISHEKDSDLYRLATTNDNDIAGIVVLAPLLLLDTGNGGVPVVDSGELLVNVSTLNGPIIPADFITVSAIPGKGMRANAGDVVVGVAKESFSLEEALLVISHDGNDVGVGTIRVKVDTGLSGTLPARGSAIDFGRSNLEAPGGGVLDIVQYLTAVLIAIGSLYVSFRNFGTNIRNGIVSIGRNPLAKSSIQSMVILNIILIILVGGGGLFVSLAILLLPI